MKEFLKYMKKDHISEKKFMEVVSQKMLLESLEDKQKLIGILNEIISYTEREPHILDCSDCIEHFDNIIIKVKTILEEVEK